MAGSGLGLSAVCVSVVVIRVKLTVTGPVMVGPEAATPVSSSRSTKKTTLLNYHLQFSRHKLL